MKNFFKIATLAFGLLISSSSLAILINDGNSVDNGVDVGSVDILLGEVDLANNGQSTETDWVNSVLASTGLTFEIKTNTVPYYSTDTLDTFAFNLATPTDYFLIKQAEYSALFQNLNDVDWGVFDVGDFTLIDLPTSDFTVSHVSEFSGDIPVDDSSTTVPEPMPLALLGLGLVGIGLVRKTHK